MADEGEMTVADLAAVLAQAQTVLGARIEDLVGAAVQRAVPAALDAVSDHLKILETRIEAAKVEAARTRQELEARMTRADTEAAGLRADLAANTKKTDDTASAIASFFADLERQRKEREAREAAEKAARQKREDAQDERFRIGVRWAVGLTTAVLGGILVNILFTALSKGALPAETIDLAIAGGVLLLALGFTLWWRTGFWLQGPPPQKGGPLP